MRGVSVAAGYKWIVLCGLTCSRVAAQPTGPESATVAGPIELRACGKSQAAQEFANAVRVEWGLEAAARPDGDPRALRVAELVRCDIEQGLIVLLHQGQETGIDVSDVPRVARPRTAAVAVTETLRYWALLLDSDSDVASEAAGDSEQSQQPSVEQAGRVQAPSAAAKSERGFMSSDGSGALGRRSAFASHADVALVARGLIIGPEQTLAYGLGASFGVVPLAWLRAELGAGYLSAADESTLGHARLHGGSASVAAEWIVGLGNPAQLRLGLGLESCWAVVNVDSAFGFDEPQRQVWFLLADVHLSWSAPVSDNWAILASLAGSKDLVGARLSAGGQPGMSFYGIGLGARFGVSHAFSW